MLHSCMLPSVMATESFFQSGFCPQLLQGQKHPQNSMATSLRQQLKQIKEEKKWREQTQPSVLSVKRNGNTVPHVSLQPPPPKPTPLPPPTPHLPLSLPSARIHATPRVPASHSHASTVQATPPPQGHWMDRLRDWMVSRGVRTLVNVYQERYREGQPNTGFGDFLRGCYFLLQVCDNLGIQCDIELRHLLGKWVECSEQRDRCIKTEIPRYMETNRGHNEVRSNGELVNHCRDRESMYKDFCAYLQQQVRRHHGHVPGGTLSMYNICFPWEEEIRPQHRECMRRWLAPTTEMRSLLDDTLSRLQLVPERYVVLHVRCGDAFLIEGNDTIPPVLLQELFRYLDALVDDNPSLSSSPILLLADNQAIKHIVQDRYPLLSLCAEYHSITHFGEGVPQHEEQVRNSMLDFYLLSCARRIYCFTTNTHGSGFSKWCAVTYQIPYVDKYLPTHR